MPDWLIASLLVVFSVHLAAFVRLGLKRRERYYIAVSLTFALLVLAFGLRLAAPELRVGDIPLHWMARRLAWASAAVSIGWLLIRRFKLFAPEQPRD